MEKIIEINNLKKSYGDVHAVKDISFYVEKGKLFSFLGPNGAGKSTTIDMLCTLLAHDSGDVTIDGYKLGKDDDKIRRSIGVVFQESLLDAYLTVRENLTIRGRFYYKDKEKLRRAVEDAVEAADLGDFIDRPYGKLSGGQRRRADIARAFLNTPQILFLDEPTTGLDPQTRKSIWQTIQKLQTERGMTVFLTTHYMEEAANSDYIIIIKNGEIAARGTPFSLKEQFSSDVLRMKSDDESKLTEYLNAKNISFCKKGELINVRIPDTKQSLDIINECKDMVSQFEVVCGTMDDVFLNVIGYDDAYETDAEGKLHA